MGKIHEILETAENFMQLCQKSKTDEKMTMHMNKR